MRHIIWGTILITIGILFLLGNFGYADFGEVIHDYWPIILVLWGFSILFRKRAPAQYTPQTPLSSGQVTADLHHQSNVFGNVMTKISSRNFKGGSISTVFGDCDVDLSEATLADGDHELHIHSVFGDSHIRLPNNVAVAISANSTFGNLSIGGERKSGFSSSMQFVSPTYPSSTNRLTITITKVFGDIQIEII